MTINMRSSAKCVKSQGVGSCYDEQVELVKRGLKDCIVTENKHGKFDLTHYHTVNPQYFLEHLWNRKRTVGIGYVHFLPETLDESLKLPVFARKIFYKYLLSFYNSMDYLVTVNPYFVERIRSYGITAPKVLCIPNFVSSETFYSMDAPEVQAARLEYQIPLNKFVVLGVGQLQTRKGVHDFVETAKRVPDAHFVWAGGFSFGMISEGYEEIKRLMDNLPDNVTFLGIVNREEMPAIYNSADIMFLPSYDELFPMSILEALCCKKPVMVRDISLYDQILFDYCMRGSDVGEFVMWVEKLMQDTDCYNYWQDQGWQCHQLYCEEAILEQWQTFYDSAYSMHSKAKIRSNHYEKKEKVRTHQNSV